MIIPSLENAIPLEQLFLNPLISNKKMTVKILRNENGEKNVCIFGLICFETLDSLYFHFCITYFENFEKIFRIEKIIF